MYSVAPLAEARPGGSRRGGGGNRCPYDTEDVLPRAVDCGTTTSGGSSTLDVSTGVEDAHRHVPGSKSCASTSARGGTGEAGGPDMGASLSQRVALRALMTG